MRWAAVASIVAKALLAALLVAAAIWPDLSGLKEKASTPRLVVYPLGAMAMPIWWAIRGRTRQGRAGFPWHADLLVTLPWLIDLAGNRLNLFDTVSWWDDVMHLLLWGFLAAGVLLAFAPRELSRRLTVMVALGFGAGAEVVWEVGEYLFFIRESPELQTAYTDTLGDMVMGSAGAVLAGVLVGWARSPDR